MRNADRRKRRIATYPDRLSKRRVSVRDAAAAIVEYRRATGDASGTVDLMLTFIEVGTEQAADLGYGDEAYFPHEPRGLSEDTRAQSPDAPDLACTFPLPVRALMDRRIAMG